MQPRPSRDAEYLALDLLELDDNRRNAAANLALYDERRQEMEDDLITVMTIAKVYELHPTPNITIYRSQQNGISILRRML